MKKIMILLVSLFLLSNVFAITDAEVNEIDVQAGTLPTSIFYGLDKAIEKIQITFTNDAFKKSKLHLKFASERLEEIKMLQSLDKDKEFLISEITNEYSNNIVKAEAWGRSISELAKLKQFEELLEASISIHIKVLEVVKQRIEDKSNNQSRSNLDKINIENIDNTLNKESRPSLEKAKKNIENINKNIKSE